MYEQVDKQKENKSKSIANSIVQKKSDVRQGFGFVDNRPKVIAQKNPKWMANDLQGDNNTAQQQPIQMMIWTFNDSRWTPTNWESVDYQKMPKGAKPEGTTYDDASETFTYPAEEEKEVVDDSLAGVAKRERIQPFLDLIGHLAAENDGSTSKGGHLLSAIRDKWKDDFNLENPDDINNKGVWHAEWSIKGKKKAGGSTMFPASWTVETLRAELMASTFIGGTMVLSPSDIRIKKAGDTFYPEM